MAQDPSSPKVVVVMPAYNAARTLVRTYRDIPPGVVDHVILVDDLSRDDTVAVAELLKLQVVVHRQNLGYGGNQKTCYDTALAEGADVVVMLHPDYQYDATRIPDLIAPILDGEADMMLGSRFLGDPLAGAGLFTGPVINPTGLRQFGRFAPAPVARRLALPFFGPFVEATAMAQDIRSATPLTTMRPRSLWHAPKGIALAALLIAGTPGWLLRPLLLGALGRNW